MPGNSSQTSADRDLSKNDDAVAAVAPSKSKSESKSKSKPCSGRDEGGTGHAAEEEEGILPQQRGQRPERQHRRHQRTSSLSSDYGGSSITSATSSVSGDADKENDGSDHNRGRRRRKSREESRVSFHAVEIREYEQILGDHPCVDSGPPLTIGWNYKSLGSVPVDAFEKCCHRLRPLDEQEIILPRYWRETLLTEKLGYESQDLARAVREVNRVKCMRRTTYNNLAYSKLEEAAEGGKRALRKVPKKLMLRTRGRKTASDGVTAGYPTVDAKYGKGKASVVSARSA